MTYEKLVRDRIPEIIEASGQTCTTRILQGDEYLQALLTKLVEEAQETRQAAADQRVEELADVLEVVDALFQALGVPEAQVREVQRQKRQARGGFAQGIFLSGVNS